MTRVDRIRIWTPAVLWAAVLLSMSGNSGSSGVTALILQYLLPPSHPTFEADHYLVRKSIHVVAYGLLGALNFRAVRGDGTGWRLRWSVIAVALAVGVASLDEWHQSFFASRTATPVDVIIDWAGATLAQMVVRRRVNRKVKGEG